MRKTTLPKSNPFLLGKHCASSVSGAFVPHRAISTRNYDSGDSVDILAALERVAQQGSVALMGRIESPGVQEYPICSIVLKCRPLLSGFLIEDFLSRPINVGEALRNVGSQFSRVSIHVGRGRWLQDGMADSTTEQFSVGKPFL
jgi:hypothetical protein